MNAAAWSRMREPRADAPSAPAQAPPRRLPGPERLYLGAVVRRDSRSLIFTVIACGISSLVSIFQFSVFTSFLQAACLVPQLVGASAWLVGRQVAAFDFPYLISRDYAGLAALCFPGASFERVLFGFAPWSSSIGRRGNVAVVGLEQSGLTPHTFAVDPADRSLLDLGGVGAAAGIGGVSMRLARFHEGLATFLGAPYTLMPYRDASRALGVPPERTSFLAVHMAPTASGSLPEQIQCARARMPEISVLTAGEFDRSSALYWLTKTGAGGAILIASLLATLLMLIILSNGISRFAQRRRRDFLSMLAGGTPPRTLVRILVGMGLLLASSSVVLALLLLPLVDAATDPVVPWVHVGGVDLVFAVVVGCVGAAIGIAAAITETRRFRIIDAFREG